MCESDIPTELADYSVKEFVRLDPHLRNKDTEKEIIPMLKSVGFTDQMLEGPDTQRLKCVPEVHRCADFAASQKVGGTIIFSRIMF